MVHEPGLGARSKSAGRLPLSCAGPLSRCGSLSDVLHESVVACSTSTVALSLPLPDLARRTLDAPGSDGDEAIRARILIGGS
jgi:hypothetical protein